MAAPKVGEAFGLDGAVVDSLNWSLALRRVAHDLRSDFIYSPHLAFIYRKAGEELIEQVRNQLKSGTFSVGIPLTIEVPKSHRLRIIGSKRPGPHSSRPGSILQPWDRLLYQALADEAADLIDLQLDAKRSFSHQLAKPASEVMFVPTRTSWNALQKALRKYAKPREIKYILKVDIANFFSALNQHTLINILKDAGYKPELASRLEVILTSLTGSRSSRGILQGMYPSDLFGNYYMEPIDRFLSDYEVNSARYVDDVYIFLDKLESADVLLQRLIPELRNHDLSIHEGKSVILPKSALVTEEPDLQDLFEDAVTEIAQQIEDEDLDVDYGFQSEWSEEDEDERDSEEAEELELKATKKLFDNVAEYPGHEENIERFCLPLFAKAESDYAVSHVLDAFTKRLSMSQIYSAYLATFIDRDEVQEALLNLAADASLPDWSRMWIVAALSQAESATDEQVKVVLRLLKDATRHDALRAVAAVYVGRFGDHTRRKALGQIYPNVSPYVQAAIYFSSRGWVGAERSNARANWGSHSPLNKLMTKALSSK